MAESGRHCEDIDLSNPDSRSVSSRPYAFSDHKKGVYTNIQHATNVQMNGTMTVYMTSDHFMKKKIKPKKPLTKSTAPVTRDQMLNIKDRLGRDWKDLGRRLHFDDAELEQMQMEYKDDLSELNYQILCRWIRGNPDSATQAGLAKIFNSMFRGDLADLLAE